MAGGAEGGSDDVASRAGGTIESGRLDAGELSSLDAAGLLS